MSRKKSSFEVIVEFIMELFDIILEGIVDILIDK